MYECLYSIHFFIICYWIKTPSLTHWVWRSSFFRLLAVKKLAIHLPGIFLECTTCKWVWFFFQDAHENVRKVVSSKKCQLLGTDEELGNVGSMHTTSVSDCLNHNWYISWSSLSAPDTMFCDFLRTKVTPYFQPFFCRIKRLFRIFMSEFSSHIYYTIYFHMKEQMPDVPAMLAKFPMRSLKRDTTSPWFWWRKSRPLPVVRHIHGCYACEHPLSYIYICLYVSIESI